MSDHKKNQNDPPSFAELLDGVKVLSNHDKVVHDTPKPRPVPKQSHRDEKRVMDELLVSPSEHEDMQPGDSLSYVKTGIQKQVFRKLKRGQYSIEAELDLHGLTRLEAQQQLNEFVIECRDYGIRCVRIIHGKGYGSSNQGPVIKPLVNQWLQRRDEILAFCSARPVDGGTGAVYVLIKST
jgi:DNA-nicking Smr family endonuclease